MYFIKEKFNILGHQELIVYHNDLMLTYTDITHCVLGTEKPVLAYPHPYWIRTPVPSTEIMYVRIITRRLCDKQN